MTRPEELQKSAALLVIPVLLTMWFVSDGGLRNGLNRLVFELIVGAFFASYGLLWGGVELFNHWRHQRNPLKFNTESATENALARCAVTAFGNYSYKLRKGDDHWYIVALSTPRAVHSRFELTGFTKCYTELPSEITVDECGGNMYSPEIEQFLTELHIRALRIECSVMGVAL